jgi:hypothetical protein
MGDAVDDAVDEQSLIIFDSAAQLQRTVLRCSESFNDKLKQLSPVQTQQLSDEFLNVSGVAIPLIALSATALSDTCEPQGIHEKDFHVIEALAKVTTEKIDTGALTMDKNGKLRDRDSESDANSDDDDSDHETYALENGTRTPCGPLTKAEHHAKENRRADEYSHANSKSNSSESSGGCPDSEDKHQAELSTAIDGGAITKYVTDAREQCLVIYRRTEEQFREICRATEDHAIQGTLTSSDSQSLLSGDTSEDSFDDSDGAGETSWEQEDQIDQDDQIELDTNCSSWLNIQPGRGDTQEPCLPAGTRCVAVLDNAELLLLFEFIVQHSNDAFKSIFELFGTERDMQIFRKAFDASCRGATPKERACVMWNVFLLLLYRQPDLQTLTKLEKRWLDLWDRLKKATIDIDKEFMCGLTKSRCGDVGPNVQFQRCCNQTWCFVCSSGPIYLYWLFKDDPENPKFENGVPLNATQNELDGIETNRNCECAQCYYTIEEFIEQCLYCSADFHTHGGRLFACAHCTHHVEYFPAQPDNRTRSGRRSIMPKPIVSAPEVKEDRKEDSYDRDSSDEEPLGQNAPLEGDAFLQYHDLWLSSAMQKFLNLVLALLTTECPFTCDGYEVPQPFKYKNASKVRKICHGKCKCAEAPTILGLFCTDCFELLRKETKQSLLQHWMQCHLHLASLTRYTEINKSPSQMRDMGPPLDDFVPLVSKHERMETEEARLAILQEADDVCTTHALENRTHTYTNNNTTLSLGAGYTPVYTPYLAIP